MADEEHLEQMKVVARLQDIKMGDDLFLSVWLYFGVPFEFIGEITVLNDERHDEGFTFFVAKAVVIDILKNRDSRSPCFEVLFARSSTLDTNVLEELDPIIRSSIGNIDYISGFIRFNSILSDFILFLRCKGNFLDLKRERLLLYWSVIYNVFFKDRIMKHGGLEAFKNEARERAGLYPYYNLAKFTSKYCHPGTDYNKDNIPALFEREIRCKYQFL